MASLTLRSDKGSPLTNDEIDDNFLNLNNELTTKLDVTSYTAADILTKLKTVDGSGSGLDADFLDGRNTSSENVPGNIVHRDASGNFSAGTITANVIGNVTGNVTGTALNITGIAAVTNGGTGANNASQARTNLGVDEQGTAIAMAIALG